MKSSSNSYGKDYMSVYTDITDLLNVFLTVHHQMSVYSDTCTTQCYTCCVTIYS